MVALSVVELVRKHDFDVKNILVAGVFYFFIIHGLKAFFFRVFLFPYYHVPAKQLPAYLMEKFLYGSFLVMSITTIIGPVFIYLKKKGYLAL